VRKASAVSLNFVETANLHAENFNSPFLSLNRLVVNTRTRSEKFNEQKFSFLSIESFERKKSEMIKKFYMKQERNFLIQKQLITQNLNNTRPRNVQKRFNYAN
jgi:hypothetical protein